MMLAIDILSWILLCGGGFLCAVGGLGMLRLPDFYTRMHAASVTDTAGMSLILLGLMLQAGFGLISFKLIVIFLFLLVTSPTATHALAHAALQDGLQPFLAESEED